MSESRSTNFVEDLFRLEVEAAGDYFFPDLGGVAEDRLDAAEPPELTTVAENSGLANRRQAISDLYLATVALAVDARIGELGRLDPGRLAYEVAWTATRLTSPGPYGKKP